MNLPKPLYYRHRFPAEIISHCVWLYFRFALSYRDVEEMMAERSIVVTYETIRDWCQKFGGTYAKRLRSRASRPGDRWHLDEVYLSINGKLQYLWRAVDQAVRFSIYWYNRGVINAPPRSSSAGSSRNCNTCPVRSSLTNWEVMPPPRQRYCLMSCTYKTNNPIIAPRIPISRPGNENVVCEASSQPDTPSGSCRASG